MTLSLSLFLPSPDSPSLSRIEFSLSLEDERGSRRDPSSEDSSPASTDDQRQSDYVVRTLVRQKIIPKWRRSGYVHDWQTT